MKLSDVFRKREKQLPSEVIEQPKATDAFEMAEQAVDIVNAGVEAGDLDGASTRLSVLTEASSASEMLVFPAPSAEWRWPLLVLFLVLTLGFVYLLLISVGAAAMSTEFRLIGMIGAAVSAVVLVVHFWFARKAVKVIRLMNRYRKYYSLMNYRTIEIVEDIAAYLHMPAETVRRDLYNAIERKWIPQGHFGTDDQILILSDDAYTLYLKEQAAYDRYYSLLIEEHRRIEERTPEVKALIALGDQYLEKIKKSDELIKNKGVSKTLERMHKIVSSIFQEVDMNPELADQLGLLLSYYLPTTEKLLDSYVDLMDKPVQGTSIRKSKREIADALKNLVSAYETILDQFFQEREMTVAGDIAALRFVIEQEQQEKENVPDEPKS